jgi:hypothetical protein
MNLNRSELQTARGPERAPGFVPASRLEMNSSREVHPQSGDDEKQG